VHLPSALPAKDAVVPTNDNKAAIWAQRGGSLAKQLGLILYPGYNLPGTITTTFCVHVGLTEDGGEGNGLVTTR